MTDPDAIVLVIDDDPSIRKAIGRLVKTAGFGVALFASAEEFLQRALTDRPACAILDVRMPGLSGLDVQRMLAERSNAIPIVFITGHGDIPMSVRAMKAGAVDFLTKPFDAHDLLNAVQQAVARHAQNKRKEADEEVLRLRVESLSPRERQVMALVVTGMLNKHVGQQLGVAEKTVKVHRARVMHKMRANSLADLVRMAAQLPT